MRASRETELAKEYPLHVVTNWLGNTLRIARKHNLMTTAADFERAAKCATASEGKGLHRTEGLRVFREDTIGIAADCSPLQLRAQINISGGGTRTPDTRIMIPLL